MAALGSLQAVQLHVSAFTGVRVASQPSTTGTAVLRTPVQMAQTLQGRVVSLKAAKTAVVEVESLKVHRLYSKRMRRTTKFLTHDEEGLAGPGDLVLCTACAPVSKRKAFKVTKVLEKYNPL